MRIKSSHFPYSIFCCESFDPHPSQIFTKESSLSRSKYFTMVADLIRDSPFGHIVRLVTRNKVFQYPEERDPKVWKKYVNGEKSGHMARHGATQPPQDEENETTHERDGNLSDASSQTQVNEASGMRVDPEKGKDKHVIDWYGDDDPQVCQQTQLHHTYLYPHCDLLTLINRIPATGPALRNSSSHSRSASLPSPSTSARPSTRPVSWT